MNSPNEAPKTSYDLGELRDRVITRGMIGVMVPVGIVMLFVFLSQKLSGAFVVSAVTALSVGLTAFTTYHAIKAALNYIDARLPNK